LSWLNDWFALGRSTKIWGESVGAMILERRLHGEFGLEFVEQ
jgi:hypothetical protein